MTLEASPQPGRPAMTAREAARTMRLDVRTVRRMLESGELAGYVQQGSKQRRWYVYADQITSGPTVGATAARSGDAALVAEVQRLQAVNRSLADANTELTAKLVAAEESNRVLLAAQATQREAFIQYRKSVDDILSGVAGYRQAAEHFERATAGLQTSGALLTSVIDNYGEALTQHGIPGHLGALMDGPPTNS